MWQWVFAIHVPMMDIGVCLPVFSSFMHIVLLCFPRTYKALHASDYSLEREIHQLSEAFYADAVRRINLLTLAFALYFPAFERLRSPRSLA